MAASLNWDQDFSTINFAQTIPSPPPTDSLFSDDFSWATNTIQVNDELTVAGWSASKPKSASTSKWWEDRSTFCKNKQQLYAFLARMSLLYALMSCFPPASRYSSPIGTNVHSTATLLGSKHPSISPHRTNLIPH